ncbi:hypothetical protein Hdeb2414_s0007g00232111 [Helianthus debilis subsp. tardiflorus]
MSSTVCLKIYQTDMFHSKPFIKKALILNTTMNQEPNSQLRPNKLEANAKELRLLLSHLSMTIL